MAYAKTRKKKRKLSSRKGSQPVQPERFEYTDSYCIFPNGSTSSTRSLFSYAKGYRTVDKTNTIRKFTPQNEAFKPFLWRYPKPFVSTGVKTTAIKAEVYEKRPSRLLPFDAAPSSPFLIASQKDIWAKQYIDTADRFNHFLNFNDKLADQKVDILTSVAEGKSTVTMLANAAKDLFSLYRHVRRADTRSVRRLLSGRGIKKSLSKGWRNKTAENRWLEIQYGWKPLIGDLKIIFEELASDKRPPAPVIKVVQSTKLKHKNYLPSDCRVGSFFGIYKTSCYYTVSSPGIRAAAQWNLGNNPLLTAWELVPYSFVVDWFLPIGDFLTQFSSSQGLEFISGTSVLYITYTAERDYDAHYTKYPYTAFVRNTSQQTCFITRREVHKSTPIGLPVFQNGLSVGRALNALALISQRRK